MEDFFNIVDYIIYIIFAINVIYLFIFSVIYIFAKSKKYAHVVPTKRIAILIPAYKEDAVIMSSVESCINQEYPKELYDTVVISDQMSDDVNDALKDMQVKLVQVFFEKSTKSKALNFAMAEISNNYDIAVILDADNIISPTFLNEINDAFVANTDIEYLQAHRVAKNTNTDMAYLDAISEEINNSIFRMAHSAIGLSAALIGSGMAFKYSLFKEIMLSIDAIGGFDKALELKLSFENRRSCYLHNSRVLDEKVQSSNDFSRQRSRWLSAQYHYFFRTVKYLPSAIKDRKWNFCDKLFQQISIPRLLLLGGIFSITIIVSLVSLSAAIKWWVLLGLLFISLFMAIPRSLYKRRIFSAVIKLPYYFIIFFGTLFHLHKANKTFIHTAHGIKGE
ncbi:MAG: glycosyltransferase family 2 protein [Muribaculaceae bacterium]